MFCHLFRLSERTGITLHTFEQCGPECKLYLGKQECAMCDYKIENLTKDKYSWSIETKIYFDPPVKSKSGNTEYRGAICLIHPAHPDMWIVENARNTHENDIWVTEYRMFFGTDTKDFVTLTDLNRFLKKEGYSGRRLAEEDFVKPVKTKE